MKTKILLLLAIVLGLAKMGNTQCSTPPLYLNSAYENGASFKVKLAIVQPVCDTFDGFEIQWRGAGDPSWVGGSLDSLFQKESDVVWTLTITYPLNVGVKYKWRVRMITYLPNGNPSYSAWTNGPTFTPEVLTPACTYPGPLSLFPPGSTDAFLLFSNTVPSGWGTPTKSKLQYRVDGTTPWTTVSNIDPTSGFYYLSGLTSATTYNWRMQNKCTGNSVYHNGPNFTTTPASVAKRPGISLQNSSATLNSSDIKKYADDDQSSAPVTEMKVYPNPANTQISISVDATNFQNKNALVSLSLKDMTGQIFWNKTNVNVTSIKNMNVNVSKLQPGVYYLQMTGIDSKIVTQQVIISR